MIRIAKGTRCIIILTEKVFQPGKFNRLIKQLQVESLN